VKSGTPLGFKRPKTPHATSNGRIPAAQESGLTGKGAPLSTPASAPSPILHPQLPGLITGQQEGADQHKLSRQESVAKMDRLFADLGVDAGSTSGGDALSSSVPLPALPPTSRFSDTIVPTKPSHFQSLAPPRSFRSLQSPKKLWTGATGAPATMQRRSTGTVFKRPSLEEITAVLAQGITETVEL
jgi:hypothetical protein